MPAQLPPPPHKTYSSLTATFSSSQAQEHLDAFLTRTTQKAYLHPDSLLSSLGIQFPPTSGPRGGLAIHHLRRIAAGLGGENLIPETTDDLARFDGDGKDVDGGDVWSERGDKRKRKHDEIEEWTETASQAAAENDVAYEIESLAGGGDEWRERNDFERQQEVWEGEVGDRMGANVIQQGGLPPAVVEHDDEGKRKTLTTDDKAARKAAKAARNLAKRQEKAKAAE